MYTLKSSELLAGKDIPAPLLDAETIKAFADATGLPLKNHDLYAVFTGGYKIEFCFDKEGRCRYVLIEEFEEQTGTENREITFIDDISLFAMTRIGVRHRFVVEAICENEMQIGHLSIFWDDDKVDSLYLFPNGRPAR